MGQAQWAEQHVENYSGADEARAGELVSPQDWVGHVFQVVEVNGTQISGAIRDTILVPPKATVKVAFDADNPGLWAFHCHNLYHMAAGMFATFVYRGFG
jgi:hypothetical protein